MYHKQDFYSSDMMKNTSLLIICFCPQGKERYNTYKIQIEDDPYYFKKYVMCYSELEERRTIDFFHEFKSGQYIAAIQNHLSNSDTFTRYKENYKNEPVYSFLVELSSKIPMMPLDFTDNIQIKTVDAFLAEEKTEKVDDINLEALDALLHIIPDFKESSVDYVLEQWSVILK